MCFPPPVCESFLNKFWRTQFYLKMAKALTRLFWSFILSILTIDQVDFPSTSLYPWIKSVFPSSDCESFLKKCVVHNFISKWRSPSPLLCSDLSFQFQRPQRTVVGFPSTSLYPWIKCGFLLQSVRVFSKNADVHNFISKWRRSCPDFFGHLYFLF